MGKHIDSKIFNTYKIDYTNNALFLGSDKGLLDSINKNHPKIWELYKQVKSDDWDENEFDFSSCVNDFKTCDKSTYDMMIKTLAWQWEADSIVSNAIAPLASMYVTSDELWCAWLRITDNECVTGDHEVLTTRGWKRIEQVVEGDIVAQWDYNTRAISFVKPEAIIKKWYNGTMYHFHDYNNNVSQITTPNHRMPVIYPYWTSEQQVPCKLSADVKYHGGNALPTSGFLPVGGRHMSPQERLYVAVQADGSLCSDKYTGGYTGHLHYKFGFSKKRKIKRLLELCEQANWKVVQINTTEAQEDMFRCYVYVPMSEYNHLAKSFDWIKLEQLTHEWATDFLDEIKNWDGNIHTRGNTRYISTNKSCIDTVSTIAHMVGMRGHISTLPARTNVLMPDGNFSDTKQAYQIYISDRPYVTGNSINKTEINYEGEVYCLTVPTSYFLTRHNNVISVTGNCVHSLTYSEIVRNSFDNPSEVLDEILSVTDSLERLEGLGNILSGINKRGHELALGYGVDFEEDGDTPIQIRTVTKDQETYNYAFKLPVALLFLERLQFIASFAVTFAIADSGLFQPIGKAVQRIAKDEIETHAELDKEVIKQEMKTERGKIAYEQTKDELEAALNAIVQQECKWVDFLFSEGRELVGLTPDILKQWIGFNAQFVFDFMDYKPSSQTIAYVNEGSYRGISGLPSKNPLPFMTNWLDMSKNQAAPQEENHGQYKVNAVHRNDEDEDFDDSF